MELVAFRRRPFAASSVYGVTSSPNAAVRSAIARPATETCIASWRSERPDARITVISECSDMRARANSVPMSPAAGSST